MLVEWVWLGTTLFSLLGLGAVGCCCPDQQQQLTIRNDEDDSAKRICPECGMQNPREAEYCGDCGFDFKA